jgi:sigma-B regulation protein RsbU (phosphoserine phosphatase)
VDVYVGVLPKIEVGADFVEVIPLGDRLVLAVGDAPGTGLKSAFVARFVCHLFRHAVTQAGAGDLGKVLDDLDRTLSPHDYFETFSMQCAVLDPGEGLATLASAGHPHPVRYSARRGKCDRLPVRGDLLNAPVRQDAPPPRREQRHVELEPGDVVVLVTDGLTEEHRLRGERYGYRFMALIEQLADRDARTIGEAILEEWRRLGREADVTDDVTVVVATIGRPGPV